ncbi:DUF5819 family protein [Promicromonospora panici]|uniref:DUF5819 family protein n=1 Tax=Promicromonospora panici TaxID=2219658 RepID=UPI00101C053B|nr:DUF5819 family protein [Promicromonospora panici]
MSSAQGDVGTRPVPAEREGEWLPDGAPVISRRVRGLVIAVWVLLLAHFAATFLWAAPGYLTGLPDGEVPAGKAPDTGVHRALEVYMTPVFAQNWSLFAPSPLHVDYALRVRGVYADGPDGDLAPGPWIDTTAVEVGALTGHLLPAATERPSRRLAADVRTAYLALPEGARDVVLQSPASTRGTIPAPVPWPGLRTALLDAGAAPGVVDDYLAEDRALAAYATQVLRASASGTEAGRASVRHPVYVQANVVRSAVTPYGAAERPEPTEFTLGVRPPVRLPGQGDGAFGVTWEALRTDVAPDGRAP